MKYIKTHITQKISEIEAKLRQMETKKEKEDFCMVNLQKTHRGAKVYFEELRKKGFHHIPCQHCNNKRKDGACKGHLIDK